MEGFRIRRGASERRAADTPALLAMASAGEVRPTDEILTSEGWTRASEHPLLRGRLGAEDPWAAWSDVESVDAASLYKKMVDVPEELPVDAVTPMGEPLPARGGRAVGPTEPTDPPPLDAEALSPVDEVVAPVAARAAGGAVVPPPVLVVPPKPNALPLAGGGRGARPPLDEPGEVIDFPRPRPPPIDTLPTQRRRPAAPPPLVRTSRVVAMIVAGLLAVLLGYAWIRVNAFSRAGVGTPDAPVARLTRKNEPAPVSPLVLLDAELRKSLSPTPRAVKKPGDLSDALLLELVQQQVQVVSADGLVTKWIGRQGDEPKTAEVRVRFRSAGDMSRELGAIALVVGRYKRFYHLEMPVFEITEEGTGGVTTIDPDKAEAYYQARLTLEELLGSITKK